MCPFSSRASPHRSLSQTPFPSPPFALPSPNYAVQDIKTKLEITKVLPPTPPPLIVPSLAPLQPQHSTQGGSGRERRER